MDRQALSCSSADFWCCFGSVPVHIFRFKIPQFQVLDIGGKKKTQGIQHCVSWSQCLSFSSLHLAESSGIGIIYNVQSL